jgi:hypothetical protein
MSKTVKHVKRPSPRREPKPAPRYLWVSKTFQWVKSAFGTHLKWDKGITYDIRRNEWKRLRKLPFSNERAARIAQIEQAWVA